MHRHQWIKYHHHRRGCVYRCEICGQIWSEKEIEKHGRIC